MGFSGGKRDLVVVGGGAKRKFRDDPNHQQTRTTFTFNEVIELYNIIMSMSVCVCVHVH